MHIWNHHLYKSCFHPPPLFEPKGVVHRHCFPRWLHVWEASIRLQWHPAHPTWLPPQVATWLAVGCHGFRELHQLWTSRDLGNHQPTSRCSLKTWHESLKIGSLPTLVRSFWTMASCISVSTSLHTPVTLKKFACGSITKENRTTTPTKDHSKYKSNVNKRHLICFMSSDLRSENWGAKEPSRIGHICFHWSSHLRIFPGLDVG